MKPEQKFRSPIEQSPMQRILTFEEKRCVRKFVEEPGELKPGAWNQIGASFVLALGGFLMIAACVITLGALSATTIKLVLLPGITSGLLLALCGAYGLHICQEAQAKRVLARALRKLTD